MPLYEKIRTPLSAEERLAKGTQLSEKELERIAVIAEKKAALDSFNAKLKTLDAEIETLATEHHEGHSSHDVEVRLEPDDARKMMNVVRVDNGQTINIRKMTLEEMAESEKRKLQGNLFPGGDAKAKGANDQPPAS